MPESYPPPAQWNLAALLQLPPDAMMVDMAAQDAPAHFVKDIGAATDGNTWRWTGRRPTLKILLTKTAGLKFLADFSLWDQAIQQTGPVTISFFIGDRLLGQMRCSAPGPKHFEMPVNPAGLQTAKDTVIAAEIDKLYRAPKDGVEFGFILIRMGFQSQ